MFHVLDIVEHGIWLSISESRVEIRKKDKEESLFFAVEDIDAVLLEEQSVSMTGCFLSTMAESRIPVILCGKAYQPSAILMPVFRDGAEFSSLLHNQIRAKKTWKKQIWKKLIVSKIIGESCNLVDFAGDHSLQGFAERVRSGDVSNLEAYSAAVYWKKLNLFPVRDRNAMDANRIFNYAYSILYAAFAREICAAALNPNIGVFHHGRNNPFSLASDLMEPFRPIIDRCVFEWLKRHPGNTVLTGPDRKEILALIYSVKIRIGNVESMLLDAVRKMVCSYKRSLKEQKVSLMFLPEAVSCGF